MDMSLKLQAEDRTAHKELAIRVSALERWKWHLIGVAAGVSAVVGLALKVYG